MAATPTGTQTLHLEPTGMTMVRLTWSATEAAISYEMEFVEGELGLGTPGTTTSNDFENPRIERSEVSLPASPAHYPHTGLKAGTRYSYRIRAVLPQDVKGPWGGAQVVTRPVAPDLSVGGATDISLTLSWDAVMLEGSPLIGTDNYTIERRESGTSNWVSLGTTLTYVTGTCTATEEACQVLDNNGGNSLGADTLYFYRIRAKDEPTGTGVEAVTSYWDHASQRTQKEPENGN
jgi:hypothetical protein